MIQHNLPQPDYGEFVGREEELALIMKLLRPYPHSRHHLLVIDGVGGVGKSTLALEIAHRCLQVSMHTSIPDEVDSRLSQLHQILVDRFNLEELRTLCFELALDYEMLPGEGKGGKARELIAYLNRRNRLEELAETIRQARPDISFDTILGKTEELAEMAERFEAIIWVSAKSDLLTSDGIIPRRQVIHTLDDVYAAISIALGREDVIRADDARRDGIVRQALTRQKTLLIVDNLETVQDPSVIDFLRELPAPTKAIVTTRHRIDIAYAVRLVGLSRKEASLLIAKECAEKHVQLSEEQAEKLFARTGGIPIALVWCIAQMANGYTVDSVLNKLGQPHSNIAKFIFEDALEAIDSASTQITFLAIAQFRSGATRDALGYVTQLPDLDLEDEVVKLQKLSLINQRNDRLDMLPLTRQFLSNVSFGSNEMRQTIQDRWLTYLRALTDENKEFNRQSYAKLDPEIDNIKGAINTCRENRLRILIDFVNNVAYYLHGSGYWNHLEKYLQWGIDISVLFEEEVPQARFYYLLANVNQYWGKLDVATKYIHRAISISEATQQTHRLALSLNRLGLIERRKMRYEKAENHFQESMALARDIESDDLIIRNHLCLSIIAIDEEDFLKAQTLLARCAVLEEQTNWQAAWWYRQRGQVATYYRKYDEAQWLLQRSLDIAEAVPMQQNVAEALFCQAQLALASGDYGLAREKANRAREVFQMLSMYPQLPETEELIQVIEDSATSNEPLHFKGHI